MENDKLYYGIGEVAKALNLSTSLLRYWETEFDCIKPTKNKKGNRFYTQHDIDLIRRIKYLTKDCGFTLEGAREQLRTNKAADEKSQMVQSLTEVRNFLVALKEEI